MCVCVCVRVCMRVCVSVCERERERERARLNGVTAPVSVLLSAGERWARSLERVLGPNAPRVLAHIPPLAQHSATQSQDEGSSDLAQKHNVTK